MHGAWRRMLRGSIRGMVLAGLRWEVAVLCRQHVGNGAVPCMQNPPFGTKRKGVDMEFLRAAFKLSR